MPGGTRRNLEDAAPDVRWADGLDDTLRLLLCDAQTSGGLLFAVPADRVDRLIDELEAAATLAAARIALGTRTIFNLLGPLASPASVKRQLIGVFDPVWARPMAETLAELGTERAMVVHGEGLDEVVVVEHEDVLLVARGEGVEQRGERDPHRVEAGRAERCRRTAGSRAPPPEAGPRRRGRLLVQRSLVTALDPSSRTDLDRRVKRCVRVPA